MKITLFSKGWLVLCVLGASGFSMAQERTDLLSDQEPSVIEFARAAEALLERFHTYPESLPEGLSIEALEDAIWGTPVFAESCQRMQCPLAVHGPEDETLTVSKVSCAYRQPSRIRICTEGWNQIQQAAQKDEIAFSTYLTLLTDTLDFRGMQSRHILARLAHQEALANQPEEPTLPLIGRRDGPVARGLNASNEAHGGFSYGRQALGAGGGIQTLNGDVEASGNFRLALEGGRFWGLGGDKLLPLGVSAELQASVAIAKDQPIYQLRVNAMGGGFAHVWVGVEANRWNVISENFGRIMLGSQFMIRRGDQQYVLVKLGAIGTHLRNEAIDATVRSGTAEEGDEDYYEGRLQSGISQALAVLVRNGKFFIEVQGDLDYLARRTPYTGDSADRDFDRDWSTRASLEVGMGYVLSFLFPNDEIRIQGRIVHYGENRSVRPPRSDFTLNFPEMTVGTFGAYYQFRFGN